MKELDNVAEGLLRGQSGKRYLCPHCQGNGMSFELIYRFVKPVKKNYQTGEVMCSSNEAEILTDNQGDPVVDVKCPYCQFVGSEAQFLVGARYYQWDQVREQPPAWEGGPTAGR